MSSGLGLAQILRKVEKMLSRDSFDRDTVSGPYERTPIGHLLDVS